MLRAKVTQEELVKRFFVSFSDGVSGDAVGNNFYDASDIEVGSCSVGQSPIGEKL